VSFGQLALHLACHNIGIRNFNTYDRFLLCGPDDVCQQVALPSSPLSASSNDSGTMLTERSSEEELNAAVVSSLEVYFNKEVCLHLLWFVDNE
jgi:hypothetical protein